MLLREKHFRANKEKSPALLGIAHELTTVLEYDPWLHDRFAGAVFRAEILLIQLARVSHRGDARLSKVPSTGI